MADNSNYVILIYIELIEIAIVMVIAVVLSYLCQPFVRSLSIPLIQIALGALLGFISMLGIINIDISAIQFEPEVFFCLCVSPLLFIDAKNANKRELVRNRGAIAFFAVVMVFLTVLALGWIMGVFESTIPFALLAAFAAALAPTDAVAVQSLKERARIPNRIMHILEGESLINDASGIVTFGFFLTIATGTNLSVSSAAAELSFSFLYVSIVGAFVGFAIASAKSLLRKAISRGGIESAPLHTLLELLTPFVVYIVAELVGASGIIAVVVAGIMYSFNFLKLNVYDARKKMISEAVWQMLHFTINGLVFILLGIQLPSVVHIVLLDNGADPLTLLLLGVAITFGIYTLRFIMGQIVMRNIKHSLMITFGGVKGAVTLATILTLPPSIQILGGLSARDIFTFIAAVVIIITLLVSNYILPLLAKPDPNTKNNNAHKENIVEIEILQEVIRELSQILKDTEMRELIIMQYNERINQLHMNVKSGQFKTSSLQKKVIYWQANVALKLAIDGRLSKTFARKTIKNCFKFIERCNGSTKELELLKSEYKDKLVQIRLINRHKYHQTQLSNPEFEAAYNNNKRGRKGRNGGINHFAVQKAVFADESDKYILKRLQQLSSVCEIPKDLPKTYATRGSLPEEIDFEELMILLEEFELKVKYISHNARRELRMLESFEDAAELGFSLERSIAQAHFDDGKISRETLRKLLRNVDLMEYSLRT